MKSPKLLSAVAVASAAIFLSANAQDPEPDDSAATDPVGYNSTTLVDGTDTLIGVTFQDVASLRGVVSSVTSGSVGLSGVTAGSGFAGTHYLLVLGGSLEGRWFPITSVGDGSVTVEDDLESLGLIVETAVSIIPFWTLGELLGEANGVPVSDDLLAPKAFVFINDLSESGTNLSAGFVFVLHDGSQLGGGEVGWFEDGTFLPSDDVLVSPESYITVRNVSGADSTLTIAGDVPITTVGISVGRIANEAQDNRITNPFPVSLTLGQSGLESVVDVSTDLLNPTDRLLVFTSENDALNPSPSAVYVYHDGSQIGGGTPGWYSDGTFVLSDDVEIPAGAPLIVRKADGLPGLGSWLPPIPYTLD
ncbi:MAG: TIGR02597 family protein [Verrucomicrobiota bacterium]